MKVAIGDLNEGSLPVVEAGAVRHGPGVRPTRKCLVGDIAACAAVATLAQVFARRMTVEAAHNIEFQSGAVAEVISLRLSWRPSRRTSPLCRRVMST